MKIGILMTGHAPDEIQMTSGDYDAMFSRLLTGYDFEFLRFDVVDMEFPKSVTDADAWLISGSRHGVYEDHPWIKPLERFIQDIYAAKVPLVGICFGHQIIAQALGGHVEKFQGGWSVGSTSYQIGQETITLNAWHQDQVITPPKGARVLGGNSFCKNAILAYDDHVLTLQPHPEFDNTVIDGLIEHRGMGKVDDALLHTAKENLDKTDSSNAMAAMIAKVLTQQANIS